jgi:hypothetical protein
MLGFCEHVDEISYYKKVGVFLDQLNDYQLLK